MSHRSMPQRDLRTWRGNKSVRLMEFDYAVHAPYHVVVRARPETRPFAASAIAQMTCQTLEATLDEAHAYLACYCLMPDHLHMLFSPCDSGLTAGTLVGRIKGKTTNLSWMFGLQGKLWQNRFYDHIVRKHEGIRSVAAYIYENPERRGLPKDYPYRYFDKDLADWM